jgi:DNA-binding GntR family transcriptional regulator
MRPVLSRKVGAEKTEERSIDDLYRALVQAILSRDLKPGMKLAEETVANAFVVNRIIVRAVLNRLHSEGLVEIQKNRGAYVASPSPAEARDVFDLRIILEREVAVRLAEHITPDQLAQLQGQVDAHRESYRRGRDGEARRSAEQFHLMAAQLVGNGALQATLGTLISRSALVMALYGTSSSSECGIDEHDEILRALRARDAAAAGRAMTHHLEHILERVRLDGGEQDEVDMTKILSRYATHAL